MNGDVRQWNEALTGSSRWCVRGAFGFAPAPCSPLPGNNFDRLIEFNLIGFRVAMVPEPGTGVLAVLAFGLMWVLRRRFK